MFKLFVVLLIILSFNFNNFLFADTACETMPIKDHFKQQILSCTDGYPARYRAYAKNKRVNGHALRSMVRFYLNKCTYALVNFLGEQPVTKEIVIETETGQALCEIRGDSAEKIVLFPGDPKSGKTKYDQLVDAAGEILEIEFRQFVYGKGFRIRTPKRTEQQTQEARQLRKVIRQY